MSESVEEKSRGEDASETVTNGLNEEAATDSSVDEPKATTTPPLAPAAKPKYRHDWYQTESDVCINILLKKVKKENVHVTFQEKMVSVRIQLEDDTYELSLELSHPVNADRCFTKVYGTKVELRMRKCEVLHWETLERKGEAPKLKLPQSVASYSTKQTEQVAHKYPSSSHYTRDWDKLVADVKQEEKDEKPEGDAALNQLFQQIYQGGSDEVKKAMNKSFMESGGTVLSTNWGEIGKDKVDCKPPDGMEWKKYEK